MDGSVLGVAPERNWLGAGDPRSHNVARPNATVASGRHHLQYGVHPLGNMGL
jgi:hypothetical protein